MLFYDKKRFKLNLPKKYIRTDLKSMRTNYFFVIFKLLLVFLFKDFYNRSKTMSNISKRKIGKIFTFVYFVMDMVIWIPVKILKVSFHFLKLNTWNIKIIITSGHAITMPTENMQEFPIDVKKTLIKVFSVYYQGWNSDITKR